MNVRAPGSDGYMRLDLDEIDVRDGRRLCDAEAVKRLSKSIRDIGLQYPITVIAKNNRFSLVAGRHRLEAFRALGDARIPAYIVKLSDLDARMWEISENLHRAELSVTQRAEQIAEYAALAKEKREAERVSAQVGQKAPYRPEGGDSLAARDLGITRQEVQRAQTIAALPEKTKEAARSLGYEDNQSALLAVAKERTPEAQIAALQTIAERGRVRRPSARPLRDLVGISGGARWIKITTPNDRPHVIRVLEMAAAILRDELEGPANDSRDATSFEAKDDVNEERYP
jgi:ParB-like chromosome segregation protein Spo0J